MYLPWDSVFKEIYGHLKLPKDVLSPLFAHVKCFLFINFFFFFPLHKREGKQKKKKDTGFISKSMKVGYSQNSNKITEKSHLVNITFCFCLCLSFYTTWQLVVLCHISKLRFTNIWLGFNIPLHMDHNVSSVHCLPVQTEVENKSFPRELWKPQQANAVSWFIGNSLDFSASLEKRAFVPLWGH